MREEEEGVGEREWVLTIGFVQGLLYRAAGVIDAGRSIAQPAWGVKIGMTALQIIENCGPRRDPLS